MHAAPVSMGWRHALIVGGTGMLAGASRFIAARTQTTSLLARTQASLSSLRQSLPAHLDVATTAVDYRSAQAFSEAIRIRVEAAGAPDVVLAWIHAEHAAQALAAQLASYGSTLRFFHVLGSASASPAASLLRRRMHYDALPGLSYHQIVLGFICDERGSRWLCDDEIAQGTIQAVSAGAPKHVVGVVEPWEARP
ncbi:hypothetical protein [Dyella mobilis]|uniref:Short chain dehydrogenase n=1 Tax=Dyella mobilis TaxID=1849582 RepID=A0ABS2KH57_9GAMM|nr:hypothetical protein [Dyella mobilis]MBM7130503.1 hypothetical protein [Dyella mobilis]GLQ97130.1 short-chain dehydrogenase [Dyella mobilis]